jgi:hypothetical protein
MNNKKQKKTLKAKILDKIYLVITAIIVQGLLIAFVYFLMGGLKITEEWLFFILFYLFYNALIIFSAVMARIVKKYRPIWISVLILVLMTNIPWIALVLLVIPGKLNLPKNVWYYPIGIMILGPATLTYYRLILKKLRKRQKEKEKEQESQTF